MLTASRTRSAVWCQLHVPKRLKYVGMALLRVPEPCEKGARKRALLLRYDAAPVAHVGVTSGMAPLRVPKSSRGIAPRRAYRCLRKRA